MLRQTFRLLLLAGTIALAPLSAKAQAIMPALRLDTSNVLKLPYGAGYLPIGTVAGNVLTPIIPPGTATQGGLIIPGLMSISATASGCNTGAWTGYIGGTQAPQPACFATEASSTINIPFAAVVGIGNATGGRVAVGDTTFEQYAQLLIQGQTSMDNNHQEDMVTLNMLISTGGGGLAQTNHNQKVALYIPVTVTPGGSNGWAINDDLTINSGVGNYSYYRHEGDMTNFNGDYKPGGCPKNNDGSSNCPAGQIDGNAFGDFMTFSGYPITAAIDFTGNPNSGSASLHYGLLFQGATGTANGQGLIDTATINDSTNAPTVLKVYSTHIAVIDTLNGSVQRIWQSLPGQLGCFNGGDDCIGDITTGIMRFTSMGGSTLQLVSSTNAYNGAQVTASAKTFGPIFGVFSIDNEANLPLNIRSLGTGNVGIGSGANGQSVAVLDAGGPAANYIGLQGAPASFGPAIKAFGSDTNVSLNFYAQNAGIIYARSVFQATGEVDFGVGSANYVQFIGAGAGFGPILSALGSDTNVVLNIRGKGASGVQILSGLIATSGFTLTGGTMQFGSYSTSSSVTPTGYISIVDSGGTARHLAVIP